MSNPFKIDHTKLTKREQRSIAALLALPVLLALIFMFYAFSKANKFEETQHQLEAERKEVRILEDRASVLQSIAEEAAAEALNQKLAAEEALKKCETKQTQP